MALCRPVRSEPPIQEAFRWTASGGITGLGWFPGAANTVSSAQGVSADGSVIVGYSYTSAVHGNAFRWTSAGGMQDLGTLASGGVSEATGISADGTVIAGSGSAPGGDNPFRWTSSGSMVSLGLSGNLVEFVEGYGISADGSVIFGAGDNTNSLTEAFRWTSSTGYTLLGFLPGTENSSSNAASSNGSVIVGNSGGEPFRWTAATGMVDLGDLPGYTYAEANDVSGDGSVVVGSARREQTSPRSFGP